MAVAGNDRLDLLPAAAVEVDGTGRVVGLERSAFDIRHLTEEVAASWAVFVARERNRRNPV